eukprot:comp18994_c0_seq1/m.21340 comp18994_c0_seq1/g.21340  ORF comp18994_c0_seq1/g.21340 comp18994_c0_seq1/m.21340 type:complete len:316 (-) comp18994_c0_seq1:681-1628(-)
MAFRTSAQRLSPLAQAAAYRQLGVHPLAPDIFGRCQIRLYAAAAGAVDEGGKDFKTLLYSVSPQGVATITLNRPKRMNAFNLHMYEELGAALNRAGSDPKVKVALLSGAGKFYSSGNDLSNFSQLIHPRKLAEASRDVLFKFVNSFIDFPRPLVAAVNGPALGIAVTTLGLCDEVYSIKSATYNTPFKKLGQAPEGCSSFMFPRIMGEENARRVLDDGYQFSADEGKTYGFIKEVFNTQEELQSFAQKRCLEIASQPETCKVRPLHQEVGLKEKLRAVNWEECVVLQEKWVSWECFHAIAEFLETKKTASGGNGD